MAELVTFNKRFLHTFQVRTLRSLDYKTRVTLNNRTHTRPDWSDEAVLIMEVIEVPESSRLPLVRLQRHLGLLKANDRVTIDVDTELGALKEDQTDHVVVFYLIPKRLFDEHGEFAQITKERAWFYVTAQDHYVEYYRERGAAAGVLYQCGAFNYSAFSKETSALIQAPKFYISDEIDSYLSIIYTFFSDHPETREDARVKLKLISSTGGPVASWEQSFKTFTPYLLSLREILKHHNVPIETGKTSLFCLYGLSTNASLLPLVINTNSKSQAIAVEHSLPPNYYGQRVGGPTRKTIISEIDKSSYFSLVGDQENG